jgi:hypothetical protein
MSQRENAAQQIALLLFVAISVALSASTYLYYRRGEEEFKRAETLSARVAHLEEAHQVLLDERSRLALAIGHPTATPVRDIEETHRQDSAEVAPDEQKKPYRNLLSILADALRGSLSRESDARAREGAALAEIGRQKEDFAERIAAEERRAAEYAKRLAEAENIFARERIRLTEIWDQLAAQLKDKLRQIGEWELKFRDMERSLSQQLAASNRKYETLRDRWERDRVDDLEHPDGLVKDVHARLGVVVINLGKADLLPKGQPFSVYDASAARIKDAKRKGTLEVTRLLDDHSAECKITSDSLKDPILPGDQIHTPLWQPGQSRRFALVAPLDFDNDGKSDYQHIRRLILASGGTIDAEVDEQGIRSGQLSVETRCVVVGAPAKKDAPRSEAATRLLDEAKQLGVDSLSAGKFFDLVGHKPPARVVNYSASRPR